MNASIKLIALGLISFCINTTLCQNMANDLLIKKIFGDATTKEIKDRSAELQTKICEKCVLNLCNGPSGNGDACRYVYECCYIRDVVSDASRPQRISSCGQRNPNGLVYKNTEVHHEDAEFAEFPWMVLIRHCTNDHIIGGGSLIAPNVVLTSALSVRDKTAQMLYVRAGEWDLESTLEPYVHQNAFVKEIVCHEEFKGIPLCNDIALLVLKSSYTLTPNVQPICLPEVNTVLDRDHCISSGWGQFKLGQINGYQPILKKVEFPILSHAACEAQLGGNFFYMYNYFQLHPSFICAGGVPGNDKFIRESGSPLVCPDRNNPERYYQVGIAPLPGLNVGTENLLYLDSSVLYSRDWIIMKLKERRVDLQYFTA
ncbi:PREDICTED: chymotrypsin-like protease CTRL-1 [Bactrocera latifrons]|uniref:Chymotrypsin-like protease CTRL-1 n=1 Tax=Bactrocera latifrons TaxID=174628 RepID=A0A0K8W963_BACLA|nr:PREDICTED: chymotrypsin-like protease CTRL-1 [Bactrocera latifrons]XP_018783330.1 PREDICTED: chymotrypsin-like protease CTRL-1 [Bactrocera latifrons]